MWGAGEQGKGRTLKARRESGRGESYHAWTKVAEVPQDLQEGLLWGHGASTPCCGGGEWHKGKVPSHSSVVHTSSSWTLRPAILSMGNGSGRWTLRPAMGEREMATAKWKASKAGGLRIRKWFIHRAPGGGYNRNFHDF